MYWKLILDTLSQSQIFYIYKDIFLGVDGCFVLNISLFWTAMVFMPLKHIKATVLIGMEFM